MTSQWRQMTAVMCFSAACGLGRGPAHAQEGSSGVSTGRQSRDTAAQAPVEPGLYLGPVELTGLTLHDARGTERELWSNADSKWLVVAFWGCECPLAKRYAPRLDEIAAEFGAQGVDVVAIDSNDQDSLTELADFTALFNMRVRLLKDPAHLAADAFHAVRTPEVFVVDRAGKIYYRGRIDDQSGIGYDQPTVKTAFLKDALHRALRGETSPPTPAVGCLIGRRPQVQPRGNVTFANTVAGIFHRYCVECHRPGQLAPFALLDYEEAAGWAPMIREVVEQGRMPPWLASPHVGKFSNDARLPDEAKASLLAWIADGCPPGNLTQTPPPPVFAKSWRIGEPDVVWYMRDEPFEVPVDGRYEYQTFFIDPHLTEDRWIQQAEILPGNVEVVHHASVWALPPGAPRDGFNVQPHVAYGPGAPPLKLPAGAALFIPAGSTIRFEMHYETKGRPASDLTCVGVRFADPNQVQRPIAVDTLLPDHPLHIPAGADRHEVHGSYYFSRDAELVSLMPHMHLRGAAFRFELELPGQPREALLDVPRWDFSWQNFYDLASPRRIPQGARLHAYGVYDNSTSNPRNPAPEQDVKAGIRTADEMFFGVFMAYDSLSEKIPLQEYHYNNEGFGAPLEASWSLQQQAPAAAELLQNSRRGDAVRVRVHELASGQHADVRIQRRAAVLRAEQSNIVFLQARASKSRRVQVRVVDAQQPERELGLAREIVVGTEWTGFNEEFVCPTDQSPALIELNVGQTYGELEFRQVALLQGSRN